MEKVKISIITVVYNGAETLEATLLSVINQTYKNIEYIIIDGGSTDGTLDIIKKYENSISLWISEPDKGIYDAMNKGIEKVTGEWVNFMNCGDLFFEKDTLGQLVLFLDKSINIIYGDTFLKFNHSNINYLSKALDFESVIFKNPFCHQSVFVRSELLKQIKFDLLYRHSADYNFFLYVFKNKLYNYRKVTSPISIYDMNGVSNSANALKEYFFITQKHYPFSWISIYHFFKFLIFVIKLKIKQILPDKVVAKLTKFPF